MQHWEHGIALFKLRPGKIFPRMYLPKCFGWNSGELFGVNSTKTLEFVNGRSESFKNFLGKLRMILPIETHFRSPIRITQFRNRYAILSTRAIHHVIFLAKWLSLENNIVNKRWVVTTHDLKTNILGIIWCGVGQHTTRLETANKKSFNDGC